MDCGLDFGLNNGLDIWTIIFTRGQTRSHTKLLSSKVLTLLDVVISSVCAEIMRL